MHCIAYRTWLFKLIRLNVVKLYLNKIQVLYYTDGAAVYYVLYSIIIYYVLYLYYVFRNPDSQYLLPRLGFSRLLVYMPSSSAQLSILG